MNPPLQFVAEISQVREVTLMGVADLRFWSECLRRENLFPAARDGLAQLLICGTDAKYKGIGFQELSISVFVNRRENGPQREGAYLAQAFNSNWFFALVERMWFSTPYDHAQIAVDVTLPASIRVQRQGHSIFQAAMVERGTAGRKAIRSGDDGWEGPIFLPGRRTRAVKKWFYARIGGETSVYPFLPDRDVVTIWPEGGHAALSWLQQSGFAGQEWVIRHSAAHAKSKTYALDAAEAFELVEPALAGAGP